MKKLFTLLLLLTMFSCQKGFDEQPKDPKAGGISFTTDILTKVNSAGFEAGDEITVSAYEGTTAVAENVTYTYDGTHFKSDTPIEYREPGQELVFTAIYPAATQTIGKFNFTIEQQQGNGDAYENSDLLTATTPATSSSQPQLSFRHQTSNIIVNVVGTSDISTATLELQSPNVIECDLINNTFSTKADEITITAAQNGDAGFKVLVAPQIVAAKKNFATLTVGADTYTWTPRTELQFESGVQYVYEWNLVDQTIKINGMVVDWSDKPGTTTHRFLADYSVTSYPSASNEWIINDVSVTDMEQFNGLYSALESARSTSRDITLIFPHLTTMYDYTFRNNQAIAKVVMPEVTAVGNSAFNNCDKLKSVDAPKARIIESSAFESCDVLNSVNFPEATEIESEAFRYCDAITEIALPKVTTIGNSVFANATSLKKIDLPMMTTLGMNSFFQCTALVEVNTPVATTIGSSAFNGCASLPSIVLPEATVIESNAFNNCDKLESVDAPKARIIESSAFESCNVLINVNLPEVTEIESEAFRYCDAITDIALPKVTTIGNSVFANATSLKKIDLPMMTTLGMNSFFQCTALVEVNTPVAMTIGSSAFNGCASLPSIVLPEATVIGSNAFNNCDKLESVDAPKARIIESSAFESCDVLNSVNFPEATEIESEAFRYCDAITDIALPKVTTIGNSVFANATSLKKIDLPMMTTIGSSAFYSCTALTKVSLTATSGFVSFGTGLFNNTLINKIELEVNRVNEQYVNTTDRTFTPPGGSNPVTYGAFKSITIIE